MNPAGYMDMKMPARPTSRPFQAQGCLQINAVCPNDVFSRRTVRYNAGMGVAPGCENAGVVRNVIEMQVPVFSLAPQTRDPGLPPAVFTDLSLLPASDRLVFEGFAATMSSPSDLLPDSVAVTVNGLLPVRNTGDRAIKDNEPVMWLYPYTAMSGGRKRAINAPPTQIGIPAAIRGLRAEDLTDVGKEALAELDTEFRQLLDQDRRARAHQYADQAASFRAGERMAHKWHALLDSRMIGVARHGAEPGGEVYLELRSVGFVDHLALF